MTNPFLKNNAAPAADATPPQAPVQAPPAAQAPPQAPPAAQAPPAIGGPSTAQAPAAEPAKDPFAAPRGASGAKIADDLNQALLLRPTEYVPDMKTSQGNTDAVRADWIVLTGENMGEVRAGSLVFQKVLKSELKGIMGTPTPMMVAILRRATEGSNGNSPAYYFEEATDELRTLAAQAAQANNWI